MLLYIHYITRAKHGQNAKTQKLYKRYLDHCPPALPLTRESSAVSVHSRTARRNAGLPSSVISKTVPDRSYTDSSILHPHTSMGISKKKARPQALKRKQRIRLEAGRDKAENVRNRTEVKTSDSIGRGTRKQQRRRSWGNIDGMIEKEVGEDIGRKIRRSTKQKHRLPERIASHGNTVLANEATETARSGKGEDMDGEASSQPKNGLEADQNRGGNEDEIL